MQTNIFIFSLLFLLGNLYLTAFTKALQLIGRIQVKKEFKKKAYFYFFPILIEKLFPKRSWESLFYILSFTKKLTSLFYATTFFFYLYPFHIYTLTSFKWLLIALIVTAAGVSCDFFVRLLVKINPKRILKIASPLAHIFLLLFSPVTLFFLKVQSLAFFKLQRGPTATSRLQIKEKILELVHESELSSLLEPLDRKLIRSMALFQERIVREILVPRIHVFSLSVNQTLHEAAQKFITEGYSRIPVYKENVDNIVGVLLYKDVLESYFLHLENSQTSPKNIPLEKLVKPALFTPETKKISNLLQEFCLEQNHIAIVVDEYGGTKGIVTIEDILEELVGEIADEYDSKEDEKLYYPLSNGGWIVDAKMNVLDIEKELGIPIPQSHEYETIGGFVFHKAGAIPSKGWKMHSDDFDLEVLSSFERNIEKLIITHPHFKR